MQGFPFKGTVSLVLLSLGGVFAFSALPEEVTRKGHQILWVFEGGAGSSGREQDRNQQAVGYREIEDDAAVVGAGGW